jgi:glutamyl endopeptidase
VVLYGWEVTMVAFSRASVIVWLALATAARAAVPGITWQDLPRQLEQKGVAVAPFNVLDCPPDVRQQRPARLVAQIIENTFYLWQEFDRGTNFCIVMQQPEARALTRPQAQALLTASTLWQAIPPANAARAVLPATDPRLRATPMPLPQRGADARGVTPQPAPGISRAAGAGRAAEPGAPAAAPDGRNVIGADDRERVTNTGVFPYSAMCYLDMEFADGAYRGSGCLVTPYMVLTCGHNVFSKSAGQWAKSVRIVPGQRQYSDGGDVEWPWGSTWAQWLHSNTRYTEGGGWEYDYAALHFDTPFWGQATYMPVEFDTTFGADDFINMSGYPGEAHGASTYSQWFAGGSVLSVVDGLLSHTMDSFGGSSGSAMYYYVPPSIRRIVGVHNFGSATSNGGAHLCAANAKLILEWMQWTPGQQAPQAQTAGAARAPDRDDGPAPVWSVPPRASFTYTNAGTARVELMIAPEADPAHADLRLRYAGAQGAATGGFAAWFEGQWMVIGAGGAAVKTFGETFRLNTAQADAAGVIWTFEHSLKPGEERGLYEKQGTVWLLKARVRTAAP